MNKILRTIYEKAKARPGRIVFPEGLDSRVQEAVSIIVRKRIAYPVLLGPQDRIKRALKRLGVSRDDLFTVIDPSVDFERYSNRLFDLRKKKGLTLAKARKLCRDETYFGTLMVEAGDADGLVSGAAHTTAETVRPALQIIKTHEAYHKVSGLFLMVLDSGVYLFADCAVTINPTTQELARIALDSARTAKKFGLRPKVAMLSFSTHGSADHEYVKKVQDATRIFRKLAPEIPVEGDIQVDAALDETIRKRKSPDSSMKGRANVLIFPDLQSGNISYKLVERLAKAKAVGPIIQGLRKPVNDLSRGCSVQDIVDVTAITVVEGRR